MILTRLWHPQLLVGTVSSWVQVKTRESKQRVLKNNRPAQHVTFYMLLWPASPDGSRQESQCRTDQTLGHNTQSLNPFALVDNILLHILGLLHRRPRLLCTWPISIIPQPNPFSQFVGTPTFDGENPQLSFSMAWSSRTFQERPRSPRLLGSQCLTQVASISSHTCM